MGTPGRDEKKKSFSFACVVGVPRNESARRNCGIKGRGGSRGGGSWGWRATKRGNRVPLDSRG